MVFLGDPLTFDADDRRDSDCEGPPEGNAELLHAPDHICRGVGVELGGRCDSEDDVSKPESLSYCGAVLPGRIIALPEDPRQARMNPINSLSRVLYTQQEDRSQSQTGR